MEKMIRVSPRDGSCVPLHKYRGRGELVRVCECARARVCVFQDEIHTPSGSASGILLVIKLQPAILSLDSVDSRERSGGSLWFRPVRRPALLAKMDRSTCFVLPSL